MLKQSKSFFDIPFFGRGFRPFFLLGAIYAVLMISAWALFFQGLISLPATWSNPVLWHAHEMIYGFAVAIIAGFLLTAVPNWTGGAPLRRINLAMLCLLWSAGRASFWYTYAPQAILSMIDLSFIPLLAANLAIPLIRAGNKRNFVFLGILALLFLGNLHMHLATFGIISSDPRISAYATVMLVIMVIAVIGGRIIPSFTIGGLRMQGQQIGQTEQGKTDIIALLFLPALVVSTAILGLESPFTGILAIGAALTNLWRMRFWHSLKTAKYPMLWILHAGYLWLVAGLFTFGLHGLHIIDQPSLALHMLTVGCIGSMTIGMMARVSLGHTGRRIEAFPSMVAAFWAIQLSALTRILAILIGGASYSLWIGISGLLWVAVFGVYTVVYTPILIGSRPDGQEP